MAAKPIVLKPIAAQSITAGTPVDLWTPAAGKAYRLLGYALSLSVAGSVIVKNKHAAAYTETLRTPLLAAGTGIADELGAGLVPGVAGDLLAIDASASGSVSGYVFGQEF